MQIASEFGLRCRCRSEALQTILVTDTREQLEEQVCRSEGLQGSIEAAAAKSKFYSDIRANYALCFQTVCVKSTLEEKYSFPVEQFVGNFLSFV